MAAIGPDGEKAEQFFPKPAMAAAPHMVAAALRAAASAQEDPQDIPLFGCGKTFFMKRC